MKSFISQFLNTKLIDKFDELLQIDIMTMINFKKIVFRKNSRATAVQTKAVNLLG